MMMIRLQVPPKLFGVKSGLFGQMIRQWIPWLLVRRHARVPKILWRTRRNQG